MAADVILLLGEELDNNDTNHYISLISFTILVYDYFLILDLEVERFWGSPRCFNWAAGFFFLNRYMVLLGHIPVMMEFFWVTDHPYKIKMSVCSLYLLTGGISHGIRFLRFSVLAPLLLTDIVLILWSLPLFRCHDLQTYHQYIAIAVQIVVAAMLIMRMYALYERSRRVLALYLTLSMSVVAVACWAVLGGKMNTKPPDIIVDVGCGITLTHNQAIRLAIAWSGMLVFDSLVFGMTLYKSLTLPRTVDLLSLLLRDGAIYFGVMIASNIANILTFILGGPFTRGVATTFTNIISSVMISHLMLNLRAPSLTVNAKGSGGHRTPADTTFPGLSFVGPGETTYPQRTMADTETSAAADVKAGDGDEERGRSRKLRRSFGSSESATRRRGASSCDGRQGADFESDMWRCDDTEKENEDEERGKHQSLLRRGSIRFEEQDGSERARGLMEGYDYVSRGPGRPGSGS